MATMEGQQRQVQSWGVCHNFLGWKILEKIYFFHLWGSLKRFFDPLNLIWPQKPPLWGGPIFAQKWLFLTFLF